MVYQTKVELIHHWSIKHSDVVVSRVVQSRHDHHRAYYYDFPFFDETSTRMTLFKNSAALSWWCLQRYLGCFKQKLLKTLKTRWLINPYSSETMNSVEIEDAEAKFYAGLRTHAIVPVLLSIGFAQKSTTNNDLLYEEYTNIYGT